MAKSTKIHIRTLRVVEVGSLIDDCVYFSTQRDQNELIVWDQAQINVSLNKLHRKQSRDHELLASPIHIPPGGPS